MSDHHGLFEPTIHVPLIYRCPSRLPKGKRVRGFVLQQDLTPTVLEILGYKGIARDFHADGKSAIPLMNEERLANYPEFYISENTWMRKRGWRTAEWKLIEVLEPDFHNKPSIELYNLIDDPKENCNLVQDEPEIVDVLKKRMTSWVEKRMAETKKPDPIMGY